MKKIDLSLLMAEEKYIKQKEYWTAVLGGDLAETSIKYDYYIEKQEQITKDYIELIINGDLYNKLIKLSKNSDLSLYIILLTALNCLIYRYNYSSDITIKSPIYKLNASEETLNDYVLIRSCLDEDMSFKDLIIKIRERSIEAYENQDYPILDILEGLDIKNEKMFNVACSMDSIHSQAGINECDSGLAFVFSKQEDGISVRLSYCTGLYSKHTANSIMGYLVNILSSAMENINTSLSKVNLINDELSQIIINSNSSNYIKDITISEAFDVQAEKTPDRVAVMYEEDNITYKELKDKSNALATLLREKGIKQDKIVGIFLDQSVEMLISIMGILKAGGAYLPISPNFPKQRIAEILEDSAIDIILSSTRMEHEALKDSSKLDVINLDMVDWEAKIQQKANLSNINRGTDLAYVLYTSGSTGKPKGVMIEHRNVINLVNALWNNIYINHEEAMNIALIAPYVFDASAQQIFAALLLGHSLCIVPEAARKNVDKLIQFYDDRAIDISDGTPMHIRMMASAETPLDGAVRVKHFIIGGEVLPPKSVIEFLNKFNSSRPKITNIYGPTECCVDSTAYLVEEEKLHNINSIPIGKPLSNIGILVLDKAGSIAPIGAMGEICIMGSGVGRGYFNNVDLTNKSFVDLQLDTKQKIYRTGDFGRILPDGNLEFLGRLDNQVKVRGYRIELGDIENQLLKLDSIKEAVVTIKEDSTENKYICAYYTVRERIDTSAIKDFLTGLLPEYMIPTYFIELDSFPLNNNGKLDIKELPEPWNVISNNRECVFPQNELEEGLLEIWKELLDLEEISTEDNFFEIGGQSLKAIMLISKVHKAFNVEIPLADIFNYTTIKDIAKYIRDAATSKCLSIEPIEQNKPYYSVSSANKRLYALHQLDNTGMAYNISNIMVIEGELDTVLFRKILKTLVSRHEALRTAFSFIDGELVQSINPSIDIDLDIIEGDESNIQKAIKDYIRPFDLNKSPLLRVMLVKVSENKHYLIMDMHHIIADGISMSILIKEFIKLYKGEELVPLRIQYKDYTAWLNNMVQEGKLKKQEEYWLNIFADNIPVLNMPTDYPRNYVRSFDGDSVIKFADIGLTNSLNELVKETGSTLFILLLACYNVLLSKYSIQDDIVVGTPVAGRQHADLDNVIGMFVNTIALRNYPKQDKSFRLFLEEVKENSIKGFENQDYQLEELIEKLKINRNTNRNPLFDAFFELQNVSIPEMKLEKLSITPYEYEIKISKFDIMLSTVEVQDRLKINLMYSTKLFSRNTAERILNDYISILEQVCKNKNVKIEDISLHNKLRKRNDSIADKMDFNL